MSSTNPPTGDFNSVAPTGNFDSPRWWKPAPGDDWVCVACNDGRPRPKKLAIRHEATQVHQKNVEYQLHREAMSSGPSAQSSSTIEAATLPALRSLLTDMSTIEPDTVPPAEADFDPDEDSEFGMQFSSYDYRMGTAELAGALLDYLNSDTSSDEELVERSDTGSNDLYEPRDFRSDYDFGDNGVEERREPKRARSAESMDEKVWYPWKSKLSCTLDILIHLPRSVFSVRQLDILRWLLDVNGVADVPSQSFMQNTQAVLQAMSGIRTIPYDGAFGHRYYVNALADMVAQEMANPRVRPNLHFYPEDAGKTVDESWQASHWLHEVDPSRLTPMAVIQKLQYFVHEPCLLSNGQACMPTRWFVRGEQTFAKAWPLRSVTSDAGSYWLVEQYHEIEVSQGQFLVSFGTWNTSHSTHGLPHASSIRGVLTKLDMPATPWTLTDPRLGNRWRVLAKGARVYGLPVWLYCDDTSGNVSKKWNKHNSFLFTPAGLPRSHVHEEYNVHFLCTSNIAPPLEMLDGIVDQFETAWNDGIWAYDCVHKDRVLVIPFVLALLGDNPMQSEFACHVGPMGKFFCRICKVKGMDRTTTERNQDSVADTAPVTLEATDNNVPSESEARQRGPARKTRKVESMADMIDRVKRFLSIGQLRTKGDTIETLRSMFVDAKQLGTQKSIKDLKTATGVKDTHLDFFMESMFKSYKAQNGVNAKQAALDAYVTQLSSDESRFLSPVWRIKGLDPHLDTPVEILHTVLLGFVKYFWRDVVQNQVKNEPRRQLLKTRLSSVDVTGLGIKKLSGHTLVQYAGSLTGRDFRAIAQVAPFVLHDLVSEPCYKTWVALANLIPLVWQPVIPDIDKHAVQLRTAIYHFLASTARWTPRWFNKPKFHVILHLVIHVRRFGPAPLFATEAFESFNAVIRAKSVHSNRQAPSRDIALAFAHGNRIRHVLSGGRILARKTLRQGPSASLQPDSQPVNANPEVPANAGDVETVWYSVGAGPLSLVSRPSTVTSYLGLDTEDVSQWGHCVSDGAPARPYMQTQTGRVFPRALPNVQESVLHANSFRTSGALTLLNGDTCAIGQWVLIRARHDFHPNVAVLREVVTQVGTPNDAHSHPDAILVQQGTFSEYDSDYCMPVISMPRVDSFLLLSIEDILCAANLQHRCRSHGCAPTGFVYVREERQTTDKTRETIVHNRPDDFVLNTARMRDSIQMESLRFPINPQAIDAEVESAILEGVRAEIDHRKSIPALEGGQSSAASATQNRGGTARGQGRARGQGQARGQGRARSRGGLSAHGESGGRQDPGPTTV